MDPVGREKEWYAVGRRMLRLALNVVMMWLLPGSTPSRGRPSQGHMPSRQIAGKEENRKPMNGPLNPHVVKPGPTRVGGLTSAVDGDRRGVDGAVSDPILSGFKLLRKVIGTAWIRGQARGPRA